LRTPMASNLDKACMFRLASHTTRWQGHRLHRYSWECRRNLKLHLLTTKDSSRLHQRKYHGPNCIIGWLCRSHRYRMCQDSTLQHPQSPMAYNRLLVGM
jgi:hypothetical protein